MRRRDLLTVKQLGEFQAFCESLDWKPEPTKGIFEVLRMRHSAQKEPLIVHARSYNAAGTSPLVHCTVWGISERLAVRFYKQRRQKQAG